MRKPYGWTVMLAVGVATLAYACGDDATTDPGAGDDVDSGVDAAKPRPDAETPPNDAGDAASPPRDAGDAGDAGDAAPEAGPPKVMVVRAGQLDGGTIGRNAAAVFVDEYELGTNTVVRTIALPSEPIGAQQRLVQSSSAIQIDEGEIARSADGHSVAVTGYTNYFGGDGPPPFVSDLSSVPRVVARIQADGKVDTTTLISDSLAPTNIGGAVMSGTDVWIAGTVGGPVGPVQYLRFANSLDGGATGGGNLMPPGAWSTHHALRIFEGQLYASTDDGRIAKVGTGLPTTGGQTEVAIVENAPGAFEFELVDTDGVAGAERLYVAVAETEPDGGVEGGVRKYTYDAAAKTWSLAATFKSGVATGVRGLAAYKSGTNVIVVTTTTEGDKILRFVDDGTASPPSTVVASAPAGVSLRGVTISPTP